MLNQSIDTDLTSPILSNVTLKATSELALSMNESLILSYNQSVCVDLSDWEWEIHYQFRWWLEGIGILLVGMVGIIFNMIAISVLQTKEMVVIRFNNLVVCLAIADNIFLLTSIFYHIGHSFGFQIQQSYVHQRLFASVVYPWRAISMCCSTYITVALALDRYNAVANPAKYKASMRSITHPIIKILHCTMPIICVSILFNIPRFFDLSIKEHTAFEEGNTTNGTIIRSYYLTGTALRENQNYVLWYVNVANFLVTGIIPLALLVYLNGQLILKRKTFIQRQIQRRRSSFHGTEYRRYSLANLKSHRQQTIILHTIVIVFLLCHALRIVLNINEWITMEDNIKARDMGCPNRRFWSSLAAPVSHLLLQINSGANFFIYSVLNETFLRVIKEKIRNILVCLKLLTKRPINSPDLAVIYHKDTNFHESDDQNEQKESHDLNGIVVKNCEIVVSESANLNEVVTANREVMFLEQPV